MHHTAVPFIMPVQISQLSKPVLMVKFYLLNLLNPLLFEARPLLEHLPYEEGIKTLSYIRYKQIFCWNTYPMKRVLRRFLPGSLPALGECRSTYPMKRVF
ncbi:MAG: hypothetical protein D3909_06985 [Candidatus Electrothrix sp. ATG1]|nr:hypothetical protein [Candidatus Electrothrix sp. ATG1]